MKAAKLGDDFMAAASWQSKSPQEKIARLFESLASGLTVYVTTRLRIVKVTKKAVDAWDKSGNPLFVAKSNGAYMRSGKSLVCIDYCGIVIRDER